MFVRFSALRDQIWPNFELIPDFMIVSVICKNGKEDSIKNEGARVAKTFPPL